MKQESQNKLTLNFSSYLVLAVILFDATASVQIQQGVQQPLKIVTWNVLAPLWVPSSFFLRSEPADRSVLDINVRIAKQIDAFNNLNADIICLQEVDEYQYEKYSEAFQAHYGGRFSPHESMHWEEYVVEPDVNKPNGNALFYRKSKLSLNEFEAVKLSSSGNVGAVGVFTFNQQHAIIAACLHLESGVDIQAVEGRKVQINATLEYLRNKEEELALDPSPTTLIMGDTNEPPTAEPTQMIFQDGFKNVFQEPTTTMYAVYGPVQLDNIYYKSGKDIHVQNANAADVNSREFDYEANIDRTEALMQTILSYKVKQLKKKNLSIADIMLEIMDFYEFIKPDKSHDMDESDPFFRSLRFGSDHLYVYTEIIFAI